jgi:hypothetical protein
MSGEVAEHFQKRPARLSDFLKIVRQRYPDFQKSLPELSEFLKKVQQGCRTFLELSGKVIGLS